MGSRQYRARSPLAQTLATELGFDPAIGFLRAMRRQGRTYLKCTVGSPEEIAALHSAAVAAGFRAGPLVDYGNSHYFPRFWVRDPREG